MHADAYRRLQEAQLHIAGIRVTTPDWMKERPDRGAPLGTSAAEIRLKGAIELSR